MKFKFNFFLYFVLFLSAFFIRLIFFPFANLDLIEYVLPWYEFIQIHDGFAALAYPFSNYSPAYPTLLVFASYIKILPAFVNIKLISVFFDFLIAIIGGKIIYKITLSKQKEFITLIILLFSPVIFVTSAYWGQCDSIYTFWVLVSFYMILSKKPILSALAFGMGIAFKLQAIFFLPILFIYLLINKNKLLESILVIPLPYLLTSIPTLVAGRPIKEVLLVYLAQSNYYNELTMKAPNFYVFFSNNYYHFFVSIGLIISFLICLLFISQIYLNKLTMKPINWLISASLLLFILPMTLPKMHERYFYAATIFAILLAIADRKKLFFAIFLQITTLFSYTYFLLGGFIISLPIISIINILNLTTIMIVLRLESPKNKLNNNIKSIKT